MAKETQTERDPARELATAGDAWLRCAACGHALTTERARLEVEGKHVHTFVNPGGFEYTIRCFREAPGCEGAGDESTFWSWFRGFAWRMTLCARCAAQVGWSFRRETSVFWGLIAQRLVG
ncbi:MAG TPA: cereblon family protein [Polyangiaceae bacterium]|jgi:hypothetical protein